jgi:release factor glutamine methyltransferase
MTVHQAYQQLLLQLYELYDDSESANIADMVFEYITGQRKIDRVLIPGPPLTATQQEKLQIITEQLLRNTPVQYVLQEAWFAGMKFYVDQHVLIPRPETEELVEWISNEARSKKPEIRTVVDIGTGSGCIPITIKKKLPRASVRAIEVSEGALNVAVKNAMLLGAQVYFMRFDFLDTNNWKDLGKFDIIVSNPPYVRASEACAMNVNVLEHEPHLALFVPDDDALLFYRNIAEFGKSQLEDNGAIFMEINEALSEDVEHLFRQKGYSIELRKDMQGKQRMVKATKRN